MEERRNAIVDLVNAMGTVAFRQLKEAFPNVSEMTLRTDLKALKLVRPNTTVFLDSGSTATSFASAMADEKMLIFTSGLTCAAELSRLERPEVYDFDITVKYNNVDTVIYVQKRPGVDQFIRTVAWEFDVFIFTASMAEYAVPVVQKILPCFPTERILTRPYCRLINGMIVKDLSIFQRDLARMILVDNSDQSFLLQPENGILVESFVGNYMDDVLLGKLLPFLRECAAAPDVRRLLTSN